MMNLDFPIVKNISVKTLAQEIIPVTPMEKGTGIFTITYHDDKEVVYDKFITVENIDKYQKLFKSDKLLLQDSIEVWDDGGWLNLAGRAGLQIVRDGKIIEKILTRIS